MSLVDIGLVFGLLIALGGLALRPPRWLRRRGEFTDDDNRDAIVAYLRSHFDR